jgi:hypothetical protein
VAVVVDMVAAAATWAALAAATWVASAAVTWEVLAEVTWRASAELTLAAEGVISPAAAFTTTALVVRITYDTARRTTAPIEGWAEVPKVPSGKRKPGGSPTTAQSDFPNRRLLQLQIAHRADWLRFERCDQVGLLRIEDGELIDLTGI